MTVMTHPKLHTYTVMRFNASVIGPVYTSLERIYYIPMIRIGRMTMETRRGRPFTIKSEDVRLYYEAIYAVTQSMEWPWTEHGAWRLKALPERDDDLPPADVLLHQMQLYLNDEALKRVKAKARRDRHRQQHKPVCVHLDYDAWALLKAYADDHQITLSEAVYRGFEAAAPD